MLRVALLAGLALLLNACGQKGPLFLPSDAAAIDSKIKASPASTSASGARP